MSLLISFFTLWSALCLQGQSPHFRHFEKELPSATVFDVLQDHSGYLWFATEVGLCRYDGQRFRDFPIPQSRGRSLSFLQEDIEGRLYVMNFNGQLFRISNDTVKEVSLPKSAQEKGVRRYFAAHSGELWIIADSVYRKKSDKIPWQAVSAVQADIETLSQIFEVEGKGVHFFAEGPDLLFIPTDSRNQYFDRQLTTPKIYQMDYFWGAYYGIQTRIRQIQYFDSINQVWKPRFADLPQRLPQFITQTYVDQAENLWILSRSGALCFSAEGKPLFEGLRLLDGYFLSGMTQDREGNYWFTTLNNGVFMLSNINLLTYEPQNSALDFEQINCLAADSEGNILVAGGGDHVFLIPPNGEALHSSPISQVDVECMFLDTTRGQLYIENEMLLVLDHPSGRQIRRLDAGATPKDIQPLSDDLLLVPSGDGAYIIHKEGKTPKLKIEGAQLVKNDLNDSTLRLRNVRSYAAFTEKERFWVAYADGLYAYEDGREHEVKTENSITALAFSRDLVTKILWVGTARQGVFGLRDGQVVKHLTKEKDGLSNNYVRTLAAYDGQLWLGTYAGVQAWHENPEKRFEVNLQDGLPSNEIKDILLQGDKVWVATAKGLAVFDKENPSPKNDISPPIYMTEFRVNEVPKSLKDVHELHYDENSIQISFQGLAFRSGGAFSYHYRLCGLDERWTTTDSRSNIIRYPALPSGKYVFEVKAINEDGVESEKVAQVSFHIHPPFWERWWFIALMILLGLAGVSLVFWLRIRAIKRRNRLESDLHRANLSALQLQMNPHFIFNSLSSIQNYLLQNQKQDADQYLAVFARLTRKVLESSREDFIPLRDEIKMLEDYLKLEQITRTHLFQFRISVSEDLDIGWTKIPPLFIQPFLENAIQHGFKVDRSEDLLEVSFVQSEGMIHVTVKDNGVGLASTTSSGHQSLATNIAQERTEAFSAITKKAVRFSVQDRAPEKGTIVEIWLPMREG
ncbi:MAG: histidine kinase [Bacteroidota bacterium]